MVSVTDGSVAFQAWIARLLALGRSVEASRLNGAAPTRILAIRGVVALLPAAASSRVTYWPSTK